MVEPLVSNVNDVTMTNKEQAKLEILLNEKTQLKVLVAELLKTKKRGQHCPVCRNQEHTNLSCLKKSELKDISRVPKESSQVCLLTTLYKICSKGVGSEHVGSAVMIILVFEF